MWIRRNFWRVLQATAGIAFAAAVVTRPGFAESAEGFPGGAPMAIIALAVAGAWSVFCLSFLVELVWSDVRAWRLGHQRPEPSATELLPLHRRDALTKQGSSNALKVLDRPAQGKALKKRQ